jgi:hypothetical protein
MPPTDYYDDIPDPCLPTFNSYNLGGINSIVNITPNKELQVSNIPELGRPSMCYQTASLIYAWPTISSPIMNAPFPRISFAIT